MNAHMKSVRNSNIEVLRAALMFAIVFGHCCVHGAFKDDLVSWALAYMTIFSVDAFVFISGWYSIRLNFRKVLRLLGVGLFASIIVGVLSFWTLGHFSFAYSLGWFGNTYLALMLLAPFLNAGVERLRGDNPKLLWGIWGAYGILLVCGWLPFKSVGFDIAPSGFKAFSISTMVFVYLTGRILADCERIKQLHGFTSFGMFAMCGLGTLGLVVLGHFCKSHAVFGWILDTDLGAYSSPLVVATAMFLFLTFLRVRIPTSFGRICLFLSPSMFSVYLLHDGCHGVAVWPIIVGVERWFFEKIGNGVISQCASICMTAMVIFVVCVAIDLIRRACLGLLKIMKG